MAPEQKRKPLGVILQERGNITEQHIDFALQEQKVTNEKLGEILLRLGFVTEYEFAIAIADQSDLVYKDLDTLAPDEELLRMFNKNLCLSNSFLPIRRDGPEVIAATSGTDFQKTGHLINRQTGLAPTFVYVENTKLMNAIHNYYYFLDNPVETLIDKEIRLLSNDPDGMRPVDKLLEHLLHLAVKYRASDIHIRPLETTVNVALRIDGVMRSMFSLPSSMKRMVSSIKTRANMDIAEQRLPQDGSFSENILNNKFNFRVSTTVCPYGENMVMRILPMKSAFLGMNQLGFLEEDVARVKEIFNEPFGIVLLTGPTGSGKTSTLYAALMTINLLEKNVMTVENPIEYRFPILRQTEVNVKAGYNFANAIRYFLRHDPDVILVGEIRDIETAETAFSASETGHMVLSTLHTNSAIGAIPRLRALGIPPFMLADSLIGVVSQRLVRKICENCREPYPPSEEELEYLGDPGITELYHGVGCDVCGHTGYVGRTLIYEILDVNRTLSALIGSDVDQETLTQEAEKNGFKNIFATAVIKAKQGVTTVAEIRRVLGNVVV